MLPATILMGASLPSIVRWARGVSWWGYLYTGNTAGAVIGCLLAGFYLLRIYNMATATYFAAAINIAVAAVSFVLASRMSGATVSEEAAEEPILVEPSRWPIYLAIGISGATALGAEVVWTRLLSVLLLGTVYVFSIILAVFLTGLAIGSGAGSWLIKRVQPGGAIRNYAVCFVQLRIAARTTNGLVPSEMQEASRRPPEGSTRPPGSRPPR